MQIDEHKVRIQSSHYGFFCPLILLSKALTSRLRVLGYGDIRKKEEEESKFMKKKIRRNLLWDWREGGKSSGENEPCGAANHTLFGVRDRETVCVHGFESV